MTGRIDAASSSGVAHCVQNLASGEFSEAHLGHRLLSGVAHWLQNREPAALSFPQFEQRIALPGKQSDWPFLYHPAQGRGSELREDDSEYVPVVNQTAEPQCPSRNDRG